MGDQFRHSPEVIAFIRFRPQLLNVFDRDANAFPPPTFLAIRWVPPTGGLP